MGADRIQGFGDLDLSAAEVFQLYSFLDGSIMVPEVRHHLRAGWGFCPRHTWAHALVEIELKYEALGWFAGWELPARLTGLPVPGVRGREET